MISLVQSYLAATAAAAAGFRLEFHNNSSQNINNPVIQIATASLLAENVDSAEVEVFARDGSSFWLRARCDWIWHAGEKWLIELRGVQNQIRNKLNGVTGAVVIAKEARLAVCCGDLENNTDLATIKPRQPLPTSKVNHQAAIAIIPWPQQLLTESLGGKLGIDAKLLDRQQRKQFDIVTELISRLYPDLDNPFTIKGRIVKIAQHPMESEHYQLIFADDEVLIKHNDAAGLHYALITLAQIGIGQQQGYEAPGAGQIYDGPRYSWRGTHLDVARHFMAADGITRLFDLMAWVKLNRFHWHLTDDEGWRIESKRFPQLNLIGSWRGPGLPLQGQYSNIDKKYGGYYRLTEISRLVSKASQLQISVMPEIDVPGHCKALLTAFPDLADPDEARESYYSVHGHCNNALNPAVPKVYRLLALILAEYIPYFPFSYFHLGGDEVAKNAWTGSPLAKALMAKYGLTNTTGLQTYFLQKLQSQLISMGKQLAAWDEASHDDRIDKTSALLFAWQSKEKTAELLAKGYKVVATPAQRYYLDMCYAPAWSEAGVTWAGTADTHEVYAYDAAAGNAENNNLIGIQAGIWTEVIWNRSRFNDMVFPRLFAIAESAWTMPRNKNYQRFASSYAALRLAQLGLNN